MFGDKLKELRKLKNLTQDDIAEMLSVTNATISVWEGNKAQPSYEILTKLATYFNVTTDYLLGFNQDDQNKIKRLERNLKEVGINDIDKVMQIINVLKEKKGE